jgi:arginyl-tRNA--protein-N-Asp/Glu arginylyltransferase
MEIRSHYLTPPHRCSYLPDQIALLEYVDCSQLNLQEYGRLLDQGWRRFGRSIFRPRCLFCTACWSLRVVTHEFRPNRSQRRTQRLNQEVISLQIGPPTVTAEKVRLHDAYHLFQSETVGWRRYQAKDAASYYECFVNNPFPTEEWCYYHQDRLVGVGYVDNVPHLGLSAIYFFYDPALRDRNLGTWNILQVIERCRQLASPYVYLGYYVEGCRSLSYKSNYRPNEILNTDQWRPFLAK